MGGWGEGGGGGGGGEGNEELTVLYLAYTCKQMTTLDPIASKCLVTL